MSTAFYRGSHALYFIVGQLEPRIRTYRDTSWHPLPAQHYFANLSDVVICRNVVALSSTFWRKAAVQFHKRGNIEVVLALLMIMTSIASRRTSRVRRQENQSLNLQRQEENPRLDVHAINKSFSVGVASGWRASVLEIGMQSASKYESLSQS